MREKIKDQREREVKKKKRGNSRFQKGFFLYWRKWAKPAIEGKREGGRKEKEKTKKNKGRKKREKEKG